ncbi:hypothetical protein [Cerasicoccus maritimus]|uniref:hypothetical protein n=1 Tax=Cerasicoccus maritimus TaxID=490089 RepID=UPI0028529A74|nr:hypothetical protein [Cerasicoccus maritimus]
MAYSAYPLLEPAVAEARQRQLNALRQSADSAVHSVDYGKTAEEIAASLGVSRSLFFYAQQIHNEIAKDPDLRPDIEEAIFIEGSGLGAVIAGLAGRKATKGKERPTSRQLDLFISGWASVAKLERLRRSRTQGSREASHWSAGGASG